MSLAAASVAQQFALRTGIDVLAHCKCSLEDDGPAPWDIVREGGVIVTITGDGKSVGIFGDDTRRTGSWAFLRAKSDFPGDLEYSAGNSKDSLVLGKSSLSDRSVPGDLENNFR